MKRRKGRSLGSRKGWFSGYSQTRFFPGLANRGRDTPLSQRGRWIYTVILTLVIGAGVAAIVYEIVRR